MLYIGSLFLVVHIFRAAALLNWSLEYVNDALFAAKSAELATYQGLQRVVLVMVAARGILYSVFLAAMYLPAAAILRKNASELAKEEGIKKDEYKSWFADFGGLKELYKIIAILLPSFLGPLTDVLFKVFI